MPKYCERDMTYVDVKFDECIDCGRCGKGLK